MIMHIPQLWRYILLPQAPHSAGYPPVALRQVYSRLTQGFYRGMLPKHWRVGAFYIAPTNICVFWREPNPDGKGRRKSAIVGTVEEYPTQAHALRAAEHMRLAANPDNPNGRLIRFGALIDRYIAEEMPQRFSTQAAYRTYLGRYIKPKWAQYSISTVKPFAVRACMAEGLAARPEEPGAHPQPDERPVQLRHAVGI